MPLLSTKHNAIMETLGFDDRRDDHAIMFPIIRSQLKIERCIKVLEAELNIYNCNTIVEKGLPCVD